MRTGVVGGVVCGVCGVWIFVRLAWIGAAVEAPQAHGQRDVEGVAQVAGVQRHLHGGGGCASLGGRGVGAAGVRRERGALWGGRGVRGGFFLHERMGVF